MDPSLRDQAEPSGLASRRAASCRLGTHLVSAKLMSPNKLERQPYREAITGA